MNTTGKLASMLLASLLLTACGGGISGTYEGGMGSIKFESGKADITLMGQTRETIFNIDGNKIVLHSPQGNLVLTRTKDGSLDTPWGTMKKTD